MHKVHWVENTEGAVDTAMLLPSVSRCRALSAVCVRGCCRCAGWYPTPAYDISRAAAGYASRAHALTILNQCSSTSAPQYFVWSGGRERAVRPEALLGCVRVPSPCVCARLLRGGQLSDGTAAVHGWQTSDGYTWAVWATAYAGPGSRWGAQLFQPTMTQCDGHMQGHIRNRPNVPANSCS